MKIFFFSLCLIPPEIGDIWVLNSLIKVQKRLSPDIHKNLRVYWGAQTHIDEINNWLVDLENAMLLLGEEIQNLKLQIHLKSDWNITTFCVTPQKYNQSKHIWKNVRRHLQGHMADNLALDIKKLQTRIISK